ncbi:molybdate ABC transporter substrate-binding protein [Bradymonadaceae bacterium TMQ3]|nr:molybdate ABC transporter substrate-binding protein [Bradymonadaceae bacterium TMQ3]TXC77862.1 molybdate ABC transporter substrate-binding protein [Bradymonadales bacterium TMQ1]
MNSADRLKRHRNARRGVTMLVALVLLAMFCGCDRGHEAPESAPLQIFVASSLTEVFEAFEAMYEASNPGVDVVISAAGSQTLRLQIEEGAPADVFVSANMRHLQALVETGHLDDERHFASNALVGIVEGGNPLEISRFEDLVRAQRLVVGGPEVPVGSYTEMMFERVAVANPGLAAELRQRIVSRERNVRQVRAKVELGEADAAFVYRSDALNFEGVEMVAIPEAFQVRASYGLGLASQLKGERRARVEDFVALTMSAQGDEVLREHGFERDVL